MTTEKKKRKDSEVSRASEAVSKDSRGLDEIRAEGLSETGDKEDTLLPVRNTIFTASFMLLMFTPGKQSLV